ncbi:MAG: DUF4179 domain-containing protein [Thermomicrobiales bacterium]
MIPGRAPLESPLSSDSSPCRSPGCAAGLHHAGRRCRALITSIGQAFGMAAGTNRIVTQHLGKELGVSQTVNGFTVTIERVYADANQIVIGYSVSGPPDRTFNNFLAFGAQRGRTADTGGRHRS